MLAVARSWTPSLFTAARRPFISARFNSQYASVDNEALNALNAVFDGVAREDVSRDKPPTAGPDGYPPSQGPAPSRVAQMPSLTDFTAGTERWRLHCHSTRNNTITTFTRPNGHVVAWTSGGKCGFKKVNRSGYEAGYQCAIRMFEKIEEIKKNNKIEIDLFFKGFGQGRDALQGALLSSEGRNIKELIVSVTDRTPIKIGGTRAKKARRL